MCADNDSKRLTKETLGLPRDGLDLSDTRSLRDNHSITEV
nr:MAG TPA_asm: hypothetical protein [Bacteriophage sp.]